MSILSRTTEQEKLPLYSETSVDYLDSVNGNIDGYSRELASEFESPLELESERNELVIQRKEESERIYQAYEEVEGYAEDEEELNRWLRRLSPTNVERATSDTEERR